MAVVMVKLQLTPEEKALLDRLSDKDGETIGEYLRVCMLTDGVMRFDQEAVRLAKNRGKEKVAKRVAKLLGLVFADAPIRSGA